MYKNHTKINLKSAMVLLCLLSVVLFIAISGFKPLDNDRELIKDKITVYMTAVRKADFLSIIEISGQKFDAGKAEEIAANVKYMVEGIMKFEVKDFTIKSIDVQGAIAFVSLEENVKITFSMPGMAPQESDDQVDSGDFKKVAGEIVLIKRDGKWKIDAVNTLQPGKIREALSNPLEFVKLQKTLGVGKMLTFLADPDLSFFIVEATMKFKGAKGQGQATACISNMKNIGTALEMYSTDNSGHYPDSLTKLTPDYLRIIPTCPAAGKQTYIDSYQVSQNPDAYTFYCIGDNHSDAGIPENHPRYDSSNGIDIGTYKEQGQEKTESMKIVKKYDRCCANLKGIGLALEMYSTDNSGKYPAKLSQLIPEYIESIPTCPSAGKDTYSESYRVSKDGNNYSFFCRGHHHKDEGAPENDPSYNSEKGLVRKKL